MSFGAKRRPHKDFILGRTLCRTQVLVVGRQWSYHKRQSRRPGTKSNILIAELLCCLLKNLNHLNTSTRINLAI